MSEKQKETNSILEELEKFNPVGTKILVEFEISKDNGYTELVYGCIVGDYYCETYGLKFKHFEDVNFDDMRQIEDHINPIFTKFSVNDFAIPSIFMEYNRGILINEADIIRSLRK